MTSISMQLSKTKPDNWQEVFPPRDVKQTFLKLYLDEKLTPHNDVSYKPRPIPNSCRKGCKEWTMGRAWEGVGVNKEVVGARIRC